MTIMDNFDWIQDTIKGALPTITSDELEKVTNKLCEDGLSQDSPDLLGMVEVDDIKGLLPTLKARKLVLHLKRLSEGAGRHHHRHTCTCNM